MKEKIEAKTQELNQILQTIQQHRQTISELEAQALRLDGQIILLKEMSEEKQ